MDHDQGRTRARGAHGPGPDPSHGPMGLATWRYETKLEFYFVISKAINKQLLDLGININNSFSVNKTYSLSELHHINQGNQLEIPFIGNITYLDSGRYNMLIFINTPEYFK